MRYKLALDTRILFSYNKISLRSGIWNIENGEIDLLNIPEEHREIFVSMMTKLQKGEGIEISDFAKLHLKISTTIQQMISAHFIVTEDSPFIFDFYTLDQANNFSESHMRINKFFVITDRKYAKESLDQILLENNINPVYPTEEENNVLNQIHSVDTTDNLSYHHSLEKIKQITQNLPVIVIQENVNLSLIRILNRSLNNGVPMFIGFIDGPFLIYISILPGFSPCFECFEQTLLSRIRDHQLYYQFASVPFNSNRTSSPLSIAAMSFLIHQSFSDVWSFYLTGKSQFCSRVLQIYLPSFEIQYQDLLRSPICPHCGYLTEKYTPISNISLHDLLNNKMLEN